MDLNRKKNFYIAIDEFKLSSEVEELVRQLVKDDQVIELEDAGIYKRTLVPMKREDENFSQVVPGRLYQLADISVFNQFDRLFGYRAQCHELSPYIRRSVHLSEPDVGAWIYQRNF